MTTTALSNLTNDERSMLEKDRNKSSSQIPNIPQIRLVNKDGKQAQEGMYFIEIKKGKDEEPEIKEIGHNPAITILYKTSTYSRFTKEDGLIAWTSDIHGFGPMDMVTLFVKKDKKVQIDFEGSYPELKKHMASKYVTVDPVTVGPKSSENQLPPHSQLILAQI